MGERVVTFGEVPKPPAPKGYVGLPIWSILKDWKEEEHQEPIWLEHSDVQWLMGFAAGHSDKAVKGDCYQLIFAIRSLGQIEVRLSWRDKEES